MSLGFYFQFWAKIFSIWWPVIFFIVVGLAILDKFEREDELNENMGND